MLRLGSKEPRISWAIKLVRIDNKKDSMTLEGSRSYVLKYWRDNFHSNNKILCIRFGLSFFCNCLELYEGYINNKMKLKTPINCKLSTIRLLINLKHYICLANPYSVRNTTRDDFALHSIMMPAIISEHWNLGYIL